MRVGELGFVFWRAFRFFVFGLNWNIPPGALFLGALWGGFYIPPGALPRANECALSGLARAYAKPL
jgi:hypothetical protein